MIKEYKSSANVMDIVRRGEIDINNQDLFFSILIKGLLGKLDDSINVRSKSVPHYVIHTGDDTMYLNMKGYNYSKETLNISTEEIYNTIPRCIVNPGSIDIDTSQLSSPYSRGTIQLEYDDNVYSLSGEFRRMPIKLTCDIKYYIRRFYPIQGVFYICNKAKIKEYNVTGP